LVEVLPLVRRISGPFRPPWASTFFAVTAVNASGTFAVVLPRMKLLVVASA
jgi:hypothetical protein